MLREPYSVGDQTQLSSMQKSVFHPSTLFLWPFPFYFFVFHCIVQIVHHNISHLNRVPWILCEHWEPLPPAIYFSLYCPHMLLTSRQEISHPGTLAQAPSIPLLHNSLDPSTSDQSKRTAGVQGWRWHLQSSGLGHSWTMSVLVCCFYPSCEFWEVSVAHWSPAWPLSTLLHVPDNRSHYCGLSCYINSGYLNGQCVWHQHL